LAVHYYDVAGMTARQVRAQLNRLGPIDPNDRKRMDAMTLWDFKWNWPGYGTAKCDLSAATVEYKIDLTLPRLVVNDETPTAVKLKWNIFLNALTEHELGHVTFAREHAADVLAAIKGSTCLAADAAAQRVLAEITRHDIEYDAETDHGVKQGVHLP
jgi:predicted secreted Zn-dependent protease